MKKGQILTHSIVVGFGVVLIIAVVIIMDALKTDYKEFVAQKEIEEVCLVVKTAIDKVYPNNFYVSETPTEVGRTEVKLPQKIAGVNYRISMNSENILIQTLDEPKLKLSCQTDINATYAGGTNGGETEFIVMRTKQGDFIQMRKL